MMDMISQLIGMDGVNLKDKDGNELDQKAMLKKAEKFLPLLEGLHTESFDKKKGEIGACYIPKFLKEIEKDKDGVETESFKVIITQWSLVNSDSEKGVYISRKLGEFDVSDLLA